MLGRSFLCFIAAAALPSCLIYDGPLLDEASGAAGDGDGDELTSGGTGGSVIGTGGGTGGVTVPVAGGAMAGGTGGMDPGDGDGSGGTMEPVEEYCTGLCIDDMNHTASGTSWPNPAGSPAFIGLNWLKYDDGSAGAEWDTLETAINWMSPRADHPDPEGTTEKELLIKGRGFEGFGIGVHVNLDAAGPDPVNLLAPVEYTGVRFHAKVNSPVENRFSVGLEDSNSTGGSAHPKTDVKFLGEEWGVYEIPFSEFEPAVDATAIIAIHFTMDPETEPYEVDFSIDDLSFYE